MHQSTLGKWKRISVNVKKKNENKLIINKLGNIQRKDNNLIINTSINIRKRERLNIIEKHYNIPSLTHHHLDLSLDS